MRLSQKALEQEKKAEELAREEAFFNKAQAELSAQTARTGQAYGHVLAQRPFGQ